ncbi:GNAT family N-acetyltransferase [Leptolyngbya sp. BC1307]|uniref:GNAT family N-acetyltransferase n=1 Tax=Leptolyngbya sp. BC1307 TaxID=2029589 RepID=UPI000EFBC257|nr:GNAT family N-acetyltransferase [Leptolyngbya sp. BC1307]
MPHHIRPATAADLHTLLGLIHLKAEFDGCPAAVTATAEKLNNTLFSSQPLAHVLLAETDSDIPVGFASYHFTYSTFRAQPSLWLDDLFIKSEHRNQSIGTDLIQRLCQIAHEHGCGRIDWTVDIHNQGGIRFYERMGGKLQTQVHLCRLSQAAIAQHVS